MQLYEQEINFIADHVLRDIKSRENIEEKQSIYLDFLKHIAKTQYEYISTELIIMSRGDKEDFFRDLEENGIYVHEPPFVGNTKMEMLVELYNIHPDCPAAPAGDFHRDCRRSPAPACRFSSALRRISNRSSGNSGK